MACDLLVATPEATFAITPAKLGVPYNLGGILTLMNMIPLPVAKEMLFTAQPSPPRRRSISASSITSPSRTSRVSFTARHPRCRQFALEHRGDEGRAATARQRPRHHARVVISGLPPPALGETFQRRHGRREAARRGVWPMRTNSLPSLGHSPSNTASPISVAAGKTACGISVRAAVFSRRYRHRSRLHGPHRNPNPQNRNSRSPAPLSGAVKPIVISMWGLRRRREHRVRSSR